jgi:hypothetical protein|nr:MAG TPA: hypothetical protein [Caudoviricetes sp.]
MKGQDLYIKLCEMELFSRVEEKREYARELLAAYNHIGEDLYPMLEKAETQNKKIVVKYGKGIDQIEEIVIE